MRSSRAANTKPLDIKALARQYGLRLQLSSFVYNETGLDFQVIHALDDGQQPWILRIPRRPDVLPRANNERRVLQFLKDKLPVAVPEWRIYDPALIAYPRLAGTPAANIDIKQKQYVWNLDPQNLSKTFITSLAKALVALHAAEPVIAIREGLRVSSPEQVRETLAAQMDRVKKELGVAEPLWQQWQAWLAEDRYWPRHTCLVHGDLQAAHILVDKSTAVTGLLDWTEAEITDPAIDFVLFLASFGERALVELLEQYQIAGGKTWPLMLEHIQQRQAAYGINIALFVLESGQNDYLEMARTALGLSG